MTASVTQISITGITKGLSISRQSRRYTIGLRVQTGKRRTKYSLLLIITLNSNCLDYLVKKYRLIKLRKKIYLLVIFQELIFLQRYEPPYNEKIAKASKQMTDTRSRCQLMIDKIDLN